MAYYSWRVLFLSLGTFLQIAAYPKLTLNVLCGAGPTFHSALSISQSTLSKHCKNEERWCTRIPRVTVVGQSRSALGIAGPRPLCSHTEFWRRSDEFYRPNEVTRHQLTHCRAQKSASCQPSTSWCDNRKRLAFKSQPLSWERIWHLLQHVLNSMRSCSEIWFPRVGIWEAGTLKWQDGAQSLVKRGSNTRVK